MSSLKGYCHHKNHDSILEKKKLNQYVFKNVVFEKFSVKEQWYRKFDI